MRKNEVEEKQDTNAWMTTYTDLMTLLLTFFVLLLSIAVIDEQNKRIALNSLVGAFGFKPGAQSIIGKKEGMNITLGSAPIKKEEISFEKLQNIAMKNDLENDMEIVKEKGRTVITLSNRILFKQGKWDIDPNAFSFLKQLGEVIKDGSRQIELRGYAARSETIFDENPVRHAMILSAQRAFSVFNFFEKENGIPSKVMAAHGFGLAKDRNAVGQKQSAYYRQVDIILDFREKIPYRLRRPRRGDSLFDYKGFFFRIPGDDHG
jgi:chemotaxis protein MotB